MMLLRRVLWMLVVLSVGLAGCGRTAMPDGDPGRPRPRGDGAVETVERAANEPAAAHTVERGPIAPVGDAGAKSAGGRDQTPPAGADGVRGEPVDDVPFLGPGAEYGVLGVEAGDALNVRAGPGVDQPVADRLDPLDRGFSVTGDAWRVDDALWVEIVDHGDVLGWVNLRYIEKLGLTADITVEQPGDAGPMTAATMRQLAAQVVHAVGYDNGYTVVWSPTRDPVLGGEQRRVVVSDGPVSGDTGEITIDMIDAYDDSIAGERLVIVGRRGAGGRYALDGVTSTIFCLRGGGDICV